MANGLREGKILKGIVMRKEMEAQIKEEADATARSFSGMVVVILEQYLAKKNKK